MEILINNSKRIVNDDSTVNDMLIELDINNPEGYAIAVNDTVVPKNEWINYRLKERDRLLLIKAAGGG